MATFLFAPYPARGHVHPTQKLARVLRSRGHRVVYASPPDAREMVASEGAEFIPLLEKQFPEGSFQPSVATRFRDRLRQIRTWVRRADNALQAMAEGALEDLFERVRADLLVCDPQFPYPALAAHGLKVPTLVFNTNLPQPLIYPFLAQPHTTLSRRLRDGAMRTGFMVANLLGIAPRMLPRIEQMARRYGYPVDALATAPEFLIRGLPEMILAPRQFIMPEGSVDPRYLLVGPSIDLERAEPAFPWERLAADKPLILFSMGSMGGYSRSLERQLLHTVLAAAKARPQWQFVFAVNPTHEATSFDGLAPNVVAVKYAPQLQLLQRAAALITHGGFNTVKESIHFGVPMMVVPLAYDQPAVAQLVKRLGLGIVRPPEKLKSQGLVAHLDELLGEPQWRSTLAAMQVHFHQSEHDNSAADALERLVRSRRG
ncbi:MAG TPA: glycosyltransferase [Myxococcaceae bacterium]|jgi:MGT family glycosyltransferase